MTIQHLTPADDLRHAHGPGRWWNESFYFNFFDPAGGLGGFARIGYSPAFGLVDGFLALRLGDGRLLLSRTRSTWTPPQQEGRVFSAGELVNRCVEPHARWELSYDGDLYAMDDPSEFALLTTMGPWALPRQRVRLSLAFDSFHPAFPYPELPQRRLPLREMLAPREGGSQLDRARLLPELLKGAVAMRDNGHLEQAGRWHGEVEVDGERHAFAGTGMRDRSWGTRDWRVLSRYRWINAQFGEQLAFNAFRVRIVGHEAWGGHVWHDGRLSALQDWSRREHSDGSATITLHPEGGPPQEVHVETENPVPLTLADTRFRTVLDEAIARFRWRNLESRGINEFVQRSYP